MNKQKKIRILILLVIVAVAILARWFFAPSPSVSVGILSSQSVQSLCNPAKSDCSKFTPNGSPFVRPTDPVIPPAPTQSGQIDEHLFIDNTLKEVNFCGRIFKVKQVKIDGVDVVQRVAEITAEMSGGLSQKDQFAKAICGNIEFTLNHRTNADVKFFPNEIEILGPSARNDISSTTVYILGIGRLTHISIDSNLQIEISKAEEGGSTIIGTLK